MLPFNVSYHLTALKGSGSIPDQGCWYTISFSFTICMVWCVYCDNSPIVSVIGNVFYWSCILRELFVLPLRNVYWRFNPIVLITLPAINARHRIRKIRLVKYRRTHRTYNPQFPMLTKQCHCKPVSSVFPCNFQSFNYVYLSKRAISRSFTRKLFQDLCQSIQITNCVLLSASIAVKCWRLRYKVLIGWGK